ncbi:MAG: TonB-dependent receptor, partial [Alphaproteobacteria bacterium]|nr:TonB-dependent receptor [Alphaproteobacteria bacterium]
LSKGMLMTALICGSIVPVLCGGTSVFAAEANAEDALSSFNLDPMIITATRTEKRDVDVPASTEILSHDEIVKRGATNAMDALTYVNGVEINRYFPGGAAMTTMTSDINIRGYGEGTLVMVNGNPINLNNTYNIDAIPTEAIERIEIVKGGSSVLYGSEAMGGVVNIITKKKGSNYITVGGGNRGQRKFNVGVGNEKFHVNYDLTRWGEIRHINDNRKPTTSATDYYFTHDRSKKENIGVGYNITDNLSIDYNHLESKVKYHREFTQSGMYSQWRDSYTNEDLVQLNYDKDDFKAHMFYNQNKINYFGETKSSPTAKWTTNNPATRKVKAFGIDLQKDFKFGEKTLLSVGGNYKYDQFHQVRNANGTTGDSRIRNTWSMFAQVDQKLTERDTIIVGGRGTWTTGSWMGNNYHNFSASGQYLHKFDQDQGVYVKAASSFIMPTWSQMEPSSSLGGQANFDLKPQRGLSYELGYKAVKGNHTYRATLFHMKVKDNITATTNGKDADGNVIFQYTNKDFKNTGFEASMDVKASEKLTYNFGFTIQNPKVYDSKYAEYGWRNKFGKYQIKAGIDYKYKKFRAALTGSYIGNRYMSPSNPKTNPGYKMSPYFLTTLTAGYAPDKNSEIALTIDNVLDRHDNVSNTIGNGGAYYYTPINFLLSYTYKF